MTYTVSARGVRKSFGGKVVLDGVDLDVASGVIFALLGPNGAGKTTLIRILATLIRPDAGTATVAGHDLLADPVGVKRAISLTGQYAAVDDMLTGEENLRMMARLLHFAPRAAEARSAELLAEFGLARRPRPPGQDLLGRHATAARPRDQHDRAARGCSSSTSRQPALTRAAGSSCGARSGGLADEGVTVLLTTQYLEEADAARRPDRAAGPRPDRRSRARADQLKSSLGGEVVRLQFGDGDGYQRALGALTILRRRPAAAHHRGRHRWLGRLGARPARHAADRRGARLAGVGRRPSLDDVFRSLTGGIR